jgi:anaerobic ribonucleoside-triphosphate reductase activating protein
LTISGGEPLDQSMQVAQFLKKLSNFDINLCLYTGYEFEEVDSLILENLDYIKTGMYIDNQKDTTNGYYGSKNQNMWVKGENGQWIKMKEK